MMTQSGPQPARNSDTAWQIAAALNLVVVEYVEDKFQLLGDIPQWFSELVPDITALNLLTKFPLLEAYLPEAKALWSGEIDSLDPSDLWTESLASGASLHLQAR